jgi:hypothetical protein
MEHHYTDENTDHDNFGVRCDLPQTLMKIHCPTYVMPHTIVSKEHILRDKTRLHLHSLFPFRKPCNVYLKQRKQICKWREKSL